MTTILVQPTVKGKLRRLASALRGRLAGEGFAWMVLAAVAAVLATLALDWLLRFPVAIRVALAVVAVAGVGYVAFRFLVRPLLVRMDSDNLALLVEQRNAALGDRLISTLQFERQRTEDRAYVSEAMIQRLAGEANTLADRINFNDVVERRGLWRMVSMALCAAALLAGLSVWQRDLMAIYVQRNVLFQNVPWPQDTYLDVAGCDADGNFYALRGDDLRVYVHARHGSVAPAEILFHMAYPDMAEAMVKSPRIDDASVTFPIRCERCGMTTTATVGQCGGAIVCEHAVCRGEIFVPAGVYANTFPVQDSFSFYVTGGDDRLDRQRPHRVIAIDPPKVSTVRFTVEFAPYMSEQSRVFTGGSGVLVAKVGSRILVEAQANKDIAPDGAFLQVDDGPMEAMRVLPADVEGRAAPRRLVGAVALGDENVRATKTLKVHLTDSDGHRNPRPNSYLIQYEEDRAPEVKFKVRSVGARVSNRVVLPLVLTVTDDCGLSKIECLRSAVNESTVHRTTEAELIADRLSGREFSDTWRLETESMRMQAGDILTVSVRAFDNMLAEMKGPNVGTSAAMVFTVTPDNELLEEINARLLSIRGDFAPSREEAVGGLEKLARAKAALTDTVLPQVLTDLKDTDRSAAAISAICSKTLLAVTAVHEEMDNNRLLPADESQDKLAQAMPKLAALQNTLVPRLREELGQAGNTTDARTLANSLTSIQEKQVAIQTELDDVYSLISQGIDINSIAAQWEKLLLETIEIEKTLRAIAEDPNINPAPSGVK
ncbi:MAG: hypothetical protein FWE88_04290 [Phycisphaerae bacterium]|nr:hypothetical protein [Phycisphaerae bacterium]